MTAYTAASITILTPDEVNTRFTWARVARAESEALRGWQEKIEVTKWLKHPR